MRPDWETIHASLGPGLHMTPYRYCTVSCSVLYCTVMYTVLYYSDLTNGGCDGVVAPDGCSGLAVVSRFPFIEVSIIIIHYILFHFSILSSVQISRILQISMYITCAIFRCPSLCVAGAGGASPGPRDGHLPHPHLRQRLQPLV